MAPGSAASGESRVGGEPAHGTWLRHLGRALGAVVLLEIGLLLLVAPWTPLWQAGIWLHQWPRLSALVANPYLRGAVSGLGFLDLWLGTSTIL